MWLSTRGISAFTKNCTRYVRIQTLLRFNESTPKARTCNVLFDTYRVRHLLTVSLLLELCTPVESRSRMTLGAFISVFGLSPTIAFTNGKTSDQALPSVSAPGR